MQSSLGTFLVPAATIVAAIIAFVAATNIVSRTKISEFRQEWIDDLRNDTAEYVGKAELWYQGWRVQNDLAQYGTDNPERLKKIREIDTLSNTARVVLWRIRLRLNPRNNRFKLEDDRFLQSLLDLLDPGKVTPDNPDSTWRRMADNAVHQGREILKREWEVTKRGA